MRINLTALLIGPLFGVLSFVLSGGGAEAAPPAGISCAGCSYRFVNAGSASSNGVCNLKVRTILSGSNGLCQADGGFCKPNAGCGIVLSLLYQSDCAGAFINYNCGSPAQVGPLPPSPGVWSLAAQVTGAIRCGFPLNCDVSIDLNGETAGTTVNAQCTPCAIVPDQN